MTHYGFEIVSASEVGFARCCLRNRADRLKVHAPNTTPNEPQSMTDVSCQAMIFGDAERIS